MNRYIVLRSLEQLCHLSLRQPHGIILQPDLEPYRLVGLIHHNLAYVSLYAVHPQRSILTSYIQQFFTRHPSLLNVHRCIAVDDALVAAAEDVAFHFGIAFQVDGGVL